MKGNIKATKKYSPHQLSYCYYNEQILKGKRKSTFHLCSFTAYVKFPWKGIPILLSEAYQVYLYPFSTTYTQGFFLHPVWLKKFK